MRVAYLDCPSGIAGDMLLGALLDAGASADAVRSAVARLPIEGWDLQTRTVTRAGIRGTKVDVTFAATEPRSGDEVRSIIATADLGDPVGSWVRTVFDKLIAAEARVHGHDPERAHLHEAGDDDALIDVVGTCAALADLEIERLVCSPLPLGSGRVSSAHGSLPVPAPAVTELLVGVPVVDGGPGELTTPTGAALVTALAHGFGPVPAMTLQSVGWGAGAADRAVPNLVRVLIGESADALEDEEVVVLEANIDDMSPELMADAAQALLHAGALDAWITPVIMKKGRPGFVLHALSSPDKEPLVRDTFLRTTTTFGVRSHTCRREILEREWHEVRVEGQSVRVKLGRRAGEVITRAVEHDDAEAASRLTGIPVMEVYRRALDAMGPKP